MKFIKKQKNTKGYYELLDLKRKGGDYSHLKNDVSKDEYIRDEVVTSLLEEQGYICAYCMRSIDLKSTTIEHIVGQNYDDGTQKGKDLQLDYDNFLAVCKGDSCRDELHCDKSRANYQKTRPLYATPLKSQITKHLKYTNSGEIYFKNYVEKTEIGKNKHHLKHSDDENIQYDISYVLNLNCHNLKEERKLVISVLKRITKNYSDKKQINKLYEKYSLEDKKYTQFSEVILYTLNRKL